MGFPGEFNCQLLFSKIFETDVAQENGQDLQGRKLTNYLRDLLF